jgi:hypothetical protein
MERTRGIRLKDIQPSSGPLTGMPIFYGGNEIVRLEKQIGKRRGWLIIYTEDPEDQGKINPNEIYWKDFVELLNENKKMP